MKVILSVVAVAVVGLSMSVLSAGIKKDLALQELQGRCIAGFISEGVNRSDIKVLTTAPYCEIIE